VTDPVYWIAVSVYPSGDVERFRSVDDLKSYVTASAIKRFDSIDIRVEDVDGQRWVAVSFAKGVWVLTTEDAPRSCPWLARGVLIQVTPWADARRALALDVRNMIQQAVGRGWSHGTDTSTSGETWVDGTPELAVEKVLAERRRVSRWTRAATAVLAPFALLFSAIALTASGVIGDALVETDSSGDFYASDSDAIIVLVVGVLSGWFVIAPLIKRTRAGWPSVTIGASSSRLWRLTKWFLILLVTALASAIIGALLALLGIPVK
jgi:hypothetical protein